MHPQPSPIRSLARQIQRRITLSVIPRVVAAALLFAAVNRHGAEFYSLLRWFVFGSAALTAAIAFRREQFAWCWLTGMVVVLFNPFAKIHLTQPTWHVLDVAAGVVFLLSVVFVFEGPKHRAA